LLDRVKAREPDAWQRLVELYGPLVYRWCRQSGVNAEDAADVVQDVFGAVARGIDTFRRQRPGDSFVAWLRTITRNKLSDHFRSRCRRPLARGGTDAQQQLAEVPEPAEPSAGDEQWTRDLLSHRWLQLARAGFESHTWEAFWRTVIDGQLPADVARDLGMSVDSVYQARCRVLRRLRQELGDLPE
jgi:RNA polymerase sigma-70 factor (ECF subfamily)